MHADQTSYPSPAQRPSATDTLVVTAELPRLSPDRLFDLWTTPEGLCRWWPQEAEVDARLGGVYHLAWPAMSWHLRGVYTDFEPPSRLGFTWAWDHEPPEHRAQVDVLFESTPDGGSRLTLTHGPYRSTEPAQQIRQGHLEGWLHFLSKLQKFQPA